MKRDGPRRFQPGGDGGPKRGRPGAARFERTRRPTKTLERVLSKYGLGSRSQARSWIHDRRVEVNGRVVENPDQWIDFKTDKINVDGRPLAAERRIYLLLYKPKGFVTTAKDPEGRPTVYELVKKVKTWIAPVGRLDLDTTGLLILTNDTRLAEHLTNPEHKVEKTYQLKVRGLLTDDQIEHLRNGVELSDGKTKPAIVTRLRNSEKYSFLEMTITEGRNRQVRRMIEAVGSKVMKLTRVAIGQIRIGDLEIGRYRELTPEEVAGLFARVG
jgi:23S rRNA pseudouridine2605 synthase